MMMMIVDDACGDSEVVGIGLCDVTGWGHLHGEHVCVVIGTRPLVVLVAHRHVGTVAVRGRSHTWSTYVYTKHILLLSFMMDDGS